MRYLASMQDPEMALLKDSSSFPILPADAAARGRDNYSLLGVLRTKPGRADSPSTLCMSCSDKIASWNVYGVQGALGARFFKPIYISAIIIGEVGDSDRHKMRAECERAFFGRLSGLQGEQGEEHQIKKFLRSMLELKIFSGLPRGYKIARTKVLFTSRPFRYSRTSLQALFPTEKIASSSNECTPPF